MRNSVQIVARKASGPRGSLELGAKQSRTERHKAEAAAALAKQYSNDYIEHDGVELKRRLFNKSTGPQV